MLFLLSMLACKPDQNIYNVTNVYEGPETPDADDGWTSEPPDCVAPVALEDVEIFEDGVTLYLELQPDQVQLMDERACGGGDPWYNYGTYDLDDDGSQCPTSVEQAWVFSPDGLCAETDQIEVTTFGQSSWQYWINPDDQSYEIPNIRIDFGEFHDQEFDDGTSHLRLSNGQAESGLVRLSIAAEIWRAMGYPAPRTSFVRVRTNMWDNELSPGTWAAYTAFEPYKKNWVRRDDLGFTSIWEGVGDPVWDRTWMECKWSEGDACEDELLSSLMEQVSQSRGNLMLSTQGAVDWHRLHQNLCLSSLTGTWDDWSHNGNNVVIALGADGIVLLPYSIDISGGHPWYSEMPGYWGWSTISSMCSDDEWCRALAIDTCITMVDEFVAMGGAAIASDRCAALEAALLARTPDAAICDQVEEFYLTQPVVLRARLEALRDGDVDTGGWGWRDSGLWIDSGDQVDSR